MKTTTVLVVVMAVIGAAVATLTLVAPNAALLLRTQVAQEVPTEDEYEFSWTPDADTPPGDYPVTVRATDDQGNVTEREIVITVLAPEVETPTPTPGTPVTPDTPRDTNQSSTSSDTGGGGGDGGGSSGGGGGGNDSAPAPAPRKTYTYEAETFRLTGKTHYSGIEPSKKTVVLAQPNAILERAISLPKGTYDLQIRAKADQPGPVLVAIYLGNKAWKIISLKESDNKYRTYQVGKLRNFSKATLRFRMLKDHWKCSPAQIKAGTIDSCDRNLYLDKVLLKSGG